MSALRFVFPIASLVAFSLSAASPAQVEPRVLGLVDDAARVRIARDQHPLACAVEDEGAVEDSLPTGRMLLLLKRSDVQESQLRDFIQAAHTPGSPSYHKWLTPEEFGRAFGPAESDLEAAKAWLQSHGLIVNRVRAGHMAIEFSGTAGQLRESFQTEIHRFLVHGQVQMASATDASVPAALGPLIAGLLPAADLHPQPQIKVMGKAQFNPRTHQTAPQWTYPENGGVAFAVAPGDFAVQYDINPVYKSGVNGAGQSIAIVGVSNVDLSLVQAYQSLFGLSANLPQVVVDGEDPGENDTATESYLDLEIAGSIAPGAKVILYTSAGSALADGLSLAAMRAVEDDLAGVISVSYAECEMQLGQSGNAFWSALWQQAAAQGQTVFVAAGDGGSAGCDDFDRQQAAYSGLRVNGIASTPYNVAVGGTDFYYSQYAGSASAIANQLATYWSQASTTAPATSLTQTIPEQAWNNFFGFNLVDGGNPANLDSQTMIAGGGGASNAALYPPSLPVAGYAKPAWQTGTGVPADRLRDLPDLSLFAANGNNYSFYPICAFPGDCTNSNLTSSGAVVITGVGGTSVSSPAMAAIQALVNQSTNSWAGQADFVYYPLAARQPSAFHDVTVGGNQVLCTQGTANCVTGSSATNSSGHTIESGFPATAGYDLATGLGSVDVANLIKYWSTVTFLPTVTTLAISPSSFVHGRTAVISGTVARSGGSGTPTGSVSLTANDGIPSYAGMDDIPLATGSFYAPLDNLPGGTYQITAVYGGDGTYGASKSTPVTVTITPENNTLATTSWAWNPFDLLLYPLSAGVTLPYGARIFLDAQPVSGNATIATQAALATGTVTFTDRLGSASTASTRSLNAAGVAEWSTGVFAPGAHTVSATYSGDPSYNPSSASLSSFTVIPGITNLTVKPLVSSVASGASVSVDAQLATGYLSLYGAPPSGNVSVTLGGNTITAPWQLSGPAGNASLEAVVTFNNVASGILPLTASYAGDGNWLGSSASGGNVLAMSAKLTPTVALTTSLASPAPSQSFTLTATLTGVQGRPTPTGTVSFLSDSQCFNVPVALVNGSATITIPGYWAANGTNIFTAVYQGDLNYNVATSNAVNVSISQSDFSLTTLNPELSISPAGSGIASLVLAPVNGFTGAVTLSASAPSGITVVPSTPNPTVNATVTDAVTLNVASTVAAGVYPVNLVATGGGHTHTVQILVNVLAVAAPVFAPAGGSYPSAQTVTITDATSGAAIYYTTNGTVPTPNSTRYTTAITVSATETIEAIAVVSGKAPSSVTTAAYTIAQPAATPTFSLAAGTYIAGQTLTLADSTPGATIHYTTNGTTPTANSTLYTGAITLSASVPATETIEAIAVASGYTSSPVATATYTIAPLAATPVFSPAPGTYTTAQTVTISDTTPGAIIYYATNGAPLNPASPRYTGPITVSATESIQAFVGSPGYANSLVVAATYTINLQTATPVISPSGGSYASAQTVTITDATPGATIYYTNNGATPTIYSPVWPGTLSVASSQTVQAFAVASGYSNSAVASAAYTITQPTPAATPVISPAGGSYGAPQTVTITDSSPGVTLYYTNNGATPTIYSPVWPGTLTVASSQTIQAIAVGNGYSRSAVASAAYTISTQAATPTISPAAGTYTSAQWVTLADTTPGATIYYTNNGAFPTIYSPVYTGALYVASTQTVQAMAVASGFANSSIASATYTFPPQAATPLISPAGGSYSSTQTVTISDSTPGAVIYYTNNGATPTIYSPVWPGTLLVTSTQTIQAIAIASGYSNSAVASAAFNLP